MKGGFSDRGRTRDKSKTRRNNSRSKSRGKNSGKCYYCGKKGHWKKDCWKHKEKSTDRKEADKTGTASVASQNEAGILSVRLVENSRDFYQNVLGFVPTRRPCSFDFDGAWLCNYGIGIHLLQDENPDWMTKKSEINPKDNHISFQVKRMINLVCGGESVGLIGLFSKTVYK